MRTATPTRGTGSACSRPAAATSTPRDVRSPARSPPTPAAPSRTTTSRSIERRAGNEAAAQTRLAGSARAQSGLSGSALRARHRISAARANPSRRSTRTAPRSPRVPTMPKRCSARHAPRSISARLDEARRDYERFVRVAPPEYRAADRRRARSASAAQRAAPVTTRRLTAETAIARDTFKVLSATLRAA